MKIPRIKEIWNSSVLRVYREYGRDSLPYAILATLLGAISSAISQFQQVSFGLIVETLGGSRESSAFPFVEQILPAGQQEKLMVLVIVLGVVYIYTTVSRILTSYLWSRYKQMLVSRLRVEAYSATQTLNSQRCRPNIRL